MENQSAGGSCCQQLAEKLEKSETGRKKLRQAIAMLKEKMEDTSKVLQVNEALRQECEKERKRADAERLKSETDRKVREKVEQESLTLKEQLVQVLKRLDRVEDHQKADQSEIVRMHCMVKEAVDGVGGVLKAVEAAQSSFHTLERNLLAKVNGAVQSSTKASSIAQREQSKVSAAETTALAAQAVAKAVQKEVQALAAHVATLQKQSSSLTQHVSTLQLDSQLQGPRTPQDSLGSEETTMSLDVTKKVTTSGAASPTSLSLPSPQNVVLSKNQLQTDAVPRSQPMLTSVCPSRMRRKSSPKQVNTRADSTLNVPTIPCLQAQAQAHRPRPGPVQIITGLQSILNPSVNQTIPASTAPSRGSQFFDRQSGDPVCKRSDVAKQFVTTTKTKEVEGGDTVVHQQGEFPKSKLNHDVVSAHNDPALSKRGNSQIGSHDKQLKDSTRVGPETAPLPGEHSPGTVREPIEDARPDLPSKLLVNIAALFEKEKKTRSKMEEKFAELQDLLGNSSESFRLHSTSGGGKAGLKRKRDVGNEVAESVHGRKRHRGKKGARKDRVRKEKTSTPVCDPNSWKLPANKDGVSDDYMSVVQAVQTEDRLIGQGEQNQFVLSEPVTGGSLETIKRDLDGPEVRDAQGDLDPKEMFSCLHSRNLLEGEGSLWDTDSEGTGDELGESWWTSKNDLLSPTLPRILPCPLSPPSICLPPVQSSDGGCSSGRGQKMISDDDGSKVSLNTVEPVTEGDAELSRGISITFSGMQDCDGEEEPLPSSHSKGVWNMAIGNQSAGEQLLPPNSCCMNLQEMSLFLEELPSVLQDVAEDSEKGEWAIEDPQLGLEKGVCGNVSSSKKHHILQECVAKDDSQRIVDGASSGDMPLEFQKGHTTAIASRMGVLGTEEHFCSKIALQHEHNATSATTDSEQLRILQEPAIEGLVSVKHVVGPMQRKDFDEAETTSTIQRLEGVLFGREAISGSTPQDAIEDLLMNTEGLLTIPAKFQALDLLLVRLRRVLIEGKAETCGIGSAEALVSSGLIHMTVRRGLWEVHGCACQDGTIENARTGAKIIAGLCQAHGRLDFLQRSMYTILLRCSYNNCWLLAMMSSFASICGRAVFSSGSEMATQAVCVIVSELLCDRNGITSEEKTDSLSKFGGITSLPMAAFHLNMMEEELEVLQHCLVGENMQRMMTLLPKLLQSLYQFLTSPMGIIPSTTLQCASWDETFTLNNGSAQTRPFVSASVVEMKDNDHRESSRPMLVQQKVESQAEKLGSGQDDKLRTFLDMCRTLELVAIHLGWKWTYNELLVGHLWSMVTPGASEVTVIHVAHIVGILGRLGIVEDGEELPGVEHLRNQLREVLQGAFTEPAKVAAAQALSHLKC
ncbi:unnamed protein product [Sphagnum balticum]